MNGSIGKCPTAWRAERLFRVVASLEGKDLGACLGLTLRPRRLMSSWWETEYDLCRWITMTLRIRCVYVKETLAVRKGRELPNKVSDMILKAVFVFSLGVDLKYGSHARLPAI